MIFSQLKNSMKCPSIKNILCFQQHRKCHQFIVSNYHNIPKLNSHTQFKFHIFSRKEQIFNTQLVKHFHSSSPKNALPGVIYLILKPILRVGAIVIGRVSRKWWLKLSPEQKKVIYSQIKKHNTKIIGISLSSIGLTFIYYFLNLETCPITGRQKFIIIKPIQVKELAGLTYDAVIDEHEKKILPIKHPAYKQPTQVVNRLLNANKVYTDQNNLKYPITIVDEPNVINAFVLPDGNIFIFTGMLQMCQTDDELATVLAHELSHTLLKHVDEKMSKKTLLEILYIVPLIFVWFLLPDLGAIITQVLLDDLKEIIFTLPFDRVMETEADEVGLIMMARACFDVRVAPLFWHKMALKENQEHIKEFLSTHPSHENRAKNLESKVKEAIDLRNECHCLPLGPLFIPRQRIFNIIKPAAAG